jgi:hypothetical protein
MDSMRELPDMMSACVPYYKHIHEHINCDLNIYKNI